MKVLFRYILFTLAVLINTVQAQNIAINATGALPDTSAMLDINSTIKGFLAPRMTKAQQDAIPLPANGLLIYNTDTNLFMVNIGTPASRNWVPLGSSGGTGWLTNGNSGTTTGTNFIGTSDQQGITFKVNNVTAGFLGLNGSSYATSFGVGSSAGFQSTALGSGALANVGNSAIAIGYQSTALGYRTIAIGASAQAANENEVIAIGYNSKASSYQSIAIGSGAEASTANSTVAIGLTSKATGYISMAVGTNAIATGQNSSAFGYQANSSGSGSLSLGVSANASNTNTIAIGNSSLASFANSTAFGAGAQAKADGANVFGNGSIASGTNTVVIGTSSTASGASSIAIGDNSDATKQNATVLGQGSTASGVGSSVYGNVSTASGANSIVIGDNSSAAGSNTTVIGNGLATTLDNVLILGNSLKKIGMGTLTPSEKVDIVGNVKFSGALMPNNLPGAPGQVLTSAGGINPPTWQTPTTNGTVTSVGLSLPNIFTVSNSPVTTSGTLTSTLISQSQNLVFASPNGAAGVPFFRALTAADIPAASGNYIQNGTASQTGANFNIGGNGTIGGTLSVTGTSTLTGAVTSNGGITNAGIFTSSGNAISLNVNSNNATNINTGTSTGTVTIGGSSNNATNINTGASTGTVTIGGLSNNINLPKLNSTAVVLTDGSKNLTSSPTATANTFLYYNGSNFIWQPSGATAWSLTGNSGTNPSTHFIGTTDGADFVIKTGNPSIESMRILGSGNGTTTQTGWIGMGTLTPRSKLDIVSNFIGKNVVTIQNSASNGYSSIDMMDNLGAQAATFGYANPSVVGNDAIKDRAYFLTYNGKDFIIATGSTPLFYVKNTGNVGIGTTTPGATLDVNGTVKLGTNGSLLTNVIKTSVTLDPGSISTTGTVVVATATIANTNSNATVIVNPRGDLPGGVAIAFCYMSGTTLKVGFINNSGAAFDPPSATYDVTVIQ